MHSIVDGGERTKGVFSSAARADDARTRSGSWPDACRRGFVGRREAERASVCLGATHVDVRGHCRGGGVHSRGVLDASSTLGLQVEKSLHAGAATSVAASLIPPLLDAVLAAEEKRLLDEGVRIAASKAEQQ